MRGQRVCLRTLAVRDVALRRRIIVTRRAQRLHAANGSLASALGQNGCMEVQLWVNAWVQLLVHLAARVDRRLGRRGRRRPWRDLEVFGHVAILDAYVSAALVVPAAHKECKHT